MAINAIAGAAAAQIATTPTLPSTGQIGWTGGAGAGPAGANGAAAAGAANADIATAAGSAVAGTQSFGRTLTQALEGLQATQTKADGLAVQAATGDLTNVHDYMIAATEASLATELTVAVRNKAVEAFNQIMNMAV
ncbi:MAG: flagellar hook-basal body complex protein FliE [Actinomycetota bacterium]|jgi:flagellar hook-basal body complex protein FliE